MASQASFLSVVWVLILIFGLECGSCSSNVGVSSQLKKCNLIPLGEPSAVSPLSGSNFENRSEVNFRTYRLADLDLKWPASRFSHEFVADDKEGPVIATLKFAHQHDSHNHPVIDVGVNEGLYTTLAGRLGYKVYGFEPQETCFPIVASILSRNGLPQFPNQITLCHNFISLDIRTSSVQPFLVDDCKQSFGAGIYTTNISLVESMSLDKTFPMPSQRFSWVKIDTEGHEIQVLKTMDIMLRQRRVFSLVVELTPKWWHNYGNISIASGIYVLNRIASFGYQLLLLKSMGIRRHRKMVGRETHIVGFSQELWNVTEGIEEWVTRAAKKPRRKHRYIPLESQANLWVLRNDAAFQPSSS